MSWPWDPARPRYPRRLHQLNAAARALARGCERVGIEWSPTPIATLSSRRGLAHPCLYCGFCVMRSTGRVGSDVVKGALGRDASGPVDGEPCLTKPLLRNLDA